MRIVRAGARAREGSILQEDTMARTAKVKMHDFPLWLTKQGLSPATVVTHTNYVQALLSALGDANRMTDGPAVRAYYLKRSVNTRRSLRPAWKLFQRYIKARADVDLPDLDVEHSTREYPDPPRLTIRAFSRFMNSYRFDDTALAKAKWRDARWYWSHWDRITLPWKGEPYDVGDGGLHAAQVLYEWGQPADLDAPIVPVEPGARTSIPGKRLLTLHNANQELPVAEGGWGQSAGRKHFPKLDAFMISLKRNPKFSTAPGSYELPDGFQFTRAQLAELDLGCDPVIGFISCGGKRPPS